jgi:hypothetical protein
MFFTRGDSGPAELAEDDVKLDVAHDDDDGESLHHRTKAKEENEHGWLDDDEIEED